jgi:hypothetical protein
MTTPTENNEPIALEELEHRIAELEADLSVISGVIERLE